MTLPRPPLSYSGRFVIGPATTNSFVLAFRSSQHHWDFRTTDLDHVSVDMCRRENRVRIVARSWGGSRVLEADIHVRTVHDLSFVVYCFRGKLRGATYLVFSFFKMTSNMFCPPIQAPDDSFGSAIYVPTPEGFSNAPGCIESYAATAVFRLYTKDGETKRGRGERALVLREEIGFKASRIAEIVELDTSDYMTRRHN